MKLRVVAENKKDKYILCPNGTKIRATKEALLKLLTNFRHPSSFKGNDGYWNSTYSDMDVAPGVTIAFVDDKLILNIIDEKMFNILTNEYISAKEYGEKHDRTQVTIRKLCEDGKIEGAYITSAGWLVPSNAPYPKRKPRRKKSKE